MLSRCIKMGRRAAGLTASGQLVLLWLLLSAVGKATGAGNPVNTAAQEGRAHRIDIESVGAWESLSRCEWAPLCPSLLLVVSLASESQQQREELEVRTQTFTCGAATQQCKRSLPSCVCHRLVRNNLPASFMGAQLSGCCTFLRYESRPVASQSIVSHHMRV